MQVHPPLAKNLRTVSLAVAFAFTLFAQPALAAKLVGTDINSGRLLYITTPSVAVSMFTTATGGKPDGVLVGPNQEIIYTLSGTGSVHIFNPYIRTDSTLATGLVNPVELLMQPGCQSILVSDIGVNKIYSISLSTRAVTTFYNGPDKMQGLTYDKFGNLFANDDQLNAIVQLDTTTGVIVNQTSATTPLTALEGLTFDTFTNNLFATSNTGQVLYQVSDDLGTIVTIPFSGEPFLHGLLSDGAGNLYVVGGDGTNSKIFQYVITTGAQNTLNTVSGLEDIARIPFGPCPKGGGTAAAVCEGE